jgi:hypothetical protein
VNTEHLSALRQAATALISTAPAPTVLAMLRTLLADPEFVWDTHCPIPGSFDIVGAERAVLV